MKIKQLIKSAKGVTSDSRDVKEGVVFVAHRGPFQDGHEYIKDAVIKKASAIILEDRAFLARAKTRIPYILVKDSKKALGQLADAFFGYPYRRIKCVGITGTNGKTTVSYLVRGILNSAGKKCGVIGTIGYRVKEANISLQNTTPGVIELHRLMKKMVDAGNRYAAMEVSSHALDQERIAGIIFKAAIFTNLTQDHLDYHKTMQEYFYAKKRLFKEYVDEGSSLIINADDDFGKRLLKSLRGKKISYGFGPGAKVRVESYGLGREGSYLSVNTPKGALEITTKLIGKHNLYNILAAVAFGITEGISFKNIIKGIEGVSYIPGRLERIDSRKGFSVFVDYAHTDDALKNVLESLRMIIHNGRIITVFGCGGDRDKGKRPKMGRVASDLSDHCIITSDNPRSEEPLEIISEIVGGVVKKNFEVEPDRLLAITRAIEMAEKNDCVLVAGKGHEAYQVIKNKVLPFDDKRVVEGILKKCSA